MDGFRFNQERIWRLCCECAATVWNKPPNDTYMFDVAQFLFEIAAQESGLQWERQRSLRYDGHGGAFSKWQMERGWISSALATLRREPMLAVRVTDYVFADPHCPSDYLTRWPVDVVEMALRMNDNDALGCALCRVGILAWPEPIPATVEARAALWKKRYNTIKGKGSEAEYIANAQRYCAGAISGFGLIA